MSKYIKKDENGFYVFDEIEFSKTLPTGLEYFAVDKETEQIYNLGINYKEKMEKQIADLEAKLAEKEAECKEITGYYYDLLECLEQRKEMQFKAERELREKYNQDKILFCIEKLEEIDKFVKSGYCFDLEDVKDAIDNQIKQLKEME